MVGVDDGIYDGMFGIFLELVKEFFELKFVDVFIGVMFCLMLSIFFFCCILFDMFVGWI